MRNCLILCTGKTIKERETPLSHFICTYRKARGTILGINAMTTWAKLDYLLFTNNNRIKKHKNNIQPDAKLLIGCHVKKQNRPGREYELINYTDRDPNEKMGYENGVIKGYYRTSGCLAIMIMHLKGAKEIWVAGMDGFTYNFNGHVHFHEDDRTNKNNVKPYKEWWERYDLPVMKVLDNLKAYGVNFKIITPTIYEKHYENSLCLS